MFPTTTEKAFSLRNDLLDMWQKRRKDELSSLFSLLNKPSAARDGLDPDNHDVRLLPQDFSIKASDKSKRCSLNWTEEDEKLGLHQITEGK